MSGRAYCNLTSSGSIVVVDIDAATPTFQLLPTTGTGGGKTEVHPGGRYVYSLQEEPRGGCTIGQLVVIDSTSDSIVTQMPLETNRVDLDPEAKDEWGLPAMRITSTSHPDDIKNMEFFRQKSIEILQAGGSTRVWAGNVNDSRGGAHNRGTCRMGNDPKTSVVDKFHRAHDVPNLFIVDGSNLVTGGRNHPTMTIQALAFRAAENLVKAAKTGVLRTKA